MSPQEEQNFFDIAFFTYPMQTGELYIMYEDIGDTCSVCADDVSEYLVSHINCLFPAYAKKFKSFFITGSFRLVRITYIKRIDIPDESLNSFLIVIGEEGSPQSGAVDMPEKLIHFRC